MTKSKNVFFKRAATQALIIAALSLGATKADAAFAVKAIYLDEADGEKRRLSETDLKGYFNVARCSCDNLIKVTIEITRDQAAKGKIRVLSGSGNCLTTENDIDETKCNVLFKGRTSEQNQDIKFDIAASKLMLKVGTACTAGEQSDFTIYVVTDQDNDEYTASTVTKAYPVDTQAPSDPIAKADSPPQAGEGLVKVFFDKSDSTEKDIKYQVLCQKTAFPDQAPRQGGPESAEYEVAANAKSCGVRTTTATDGGVPLTDGAAPTDASPSDALSSDASTTDASAVDAGASDAFVPQGGIAGLDPMFVCSKASSSAGSVLVEGLEDGTSYRFYVVSIDAAKNPSALVDLGTGTPAREEDLWERYKRSGGGAGGGCALSRTLGGGLGGAAIVVLLFAGLLFLRRRRAKIGLFVGLTLLLGAARADAQVIDKESYTSPQSYAIEIKFGPYAPNIDAEFNGAKKPFGDLFGDGEALMVRAEFDYQIWGGFGSIGVGLSAGYYGNSANSLADNGTDTSPSTSTERSAGTSGITLIPVSVLAVYRFDVLANRWNIPVVPFVKFGLNYTIWMIRQGNDSLADYQGDDAMGGSWGIQFNAGIALQLDIFEPTAAKNLDNESGINHSYLFFEFVHVGADGFGSASKLNVGDTTWQAGLAFEF